MISVCMATRNGAPYLAEQLESILCQLSSKDEIIVVDDASDDGTEAVVKSAGNGKISIHRNEERMGTTRAFELALRHAKGEIIFLADQDDVWLPEKVRRMVSALQTHDLVVCDCCLTDAALQPMHPSFFELNQSGQGLWRNLWKNSYMGCCMAFRRSVLVRSLPFPRNIPSHDSWIGAVAERHFTVKFLPEVLVYHRRHGKNASTNGMASSLTRQQQITNRLNLVTNLIFH